MNRVRVLSFGAGVQSSALLLMCDRGDIEPVDFAVFADPGAEPEEVYRWLEHLRQHIKTPIYIAQKTNIHTDVVGHWAGTIRRCGQPPLFARDHRDKVGMIRRHCTKEYKIEVVDRSIRNALRYRPRQRMRHHIDLLMGISYDEMGRMRIASQKWKTNHYPLVDREITRQQCIEYVQNLGIGTPPRSACYFCPYKTNEEWRRLRDESPADWQKAVEFDEAIRTSSSPKLTSRFYVHRSAVPLAQADLGTSDEGHHSMQDECEGICGV